MQFHRAGFSRQLYAVAVSLATGGHALESRALGWFAALVGFVDVASGIRSAIALDGDRLENEYVLHLDQTIDTEVILAGRGPTRRRAARETPEPACFEGCGLDRVPGTRRLGCRNEASEDSL